MIIKLVITSQPISIPERNVLAYIYVRHRREERSSHSNYRADRLSDRRSYPSTAFRPARSRSRSRGRRSGAGVASRNGRDGYRVSSHRSRSRDRDRDRRRQRDDDRRPSGGSRRERDRKRSVESHSSDDQILDVEVPASDEEDEEAIIERRRKERAAMLERLRLQAASTQDEDSNAGMSSQAVSPMPSGGGDDMKREQTPDSDAVADEAVSIKA